MSECVECSICLEEIGMWDNCTTNCGHKFHVSCLWATRNPFCPYCARDVRLNPNLPKMEPKNDKEKILNAMEELNMPINAVHEVVEQMMEEDPEYNRKMEEEERERQAIIDKIKTEYVAMRQEKLAATNPTKAQLFAIKKR